VGDGLLWSPANEELLRQQQIRIFISYCSAERRVVEGLEAELARAFDRRGEPHDIWRDRWRIRAGEPFQERIAEAVQAADYLLVVASEHSLRSGWVNAEWRHKYASEISDGRVRVIPLTLGKLDRAKLPDFLRGKHTLSLPRELAKLRYACDELARQLVELRDESARIKAAA
jgi:hypothetical protein